MALTGHLTTAAGRAASMAEVLARLEAEAVHGAASGVMPTGFAVLDHVLEGGLRTGDLTLIGGHPGVGKTVMTLQWGRNLALAGTPAVYVSYEHDERSLFGRVLLLEVGGLPAPEGRGPSDGEVRRSVRAVVRGSASLKDECAGNLRLRAASARVSEYQHRLRLLRGSSVTGLDELEALLAEQAGPSILFVDYLQKVPVNGSWATGERVRRVGERLKEMALNQDAAVVAVVAGDRTGLLERRLRLHHIQGAAALAYEADVVLMLNDKFHAVSRAHTAYDTVRAERFRRQVVVTVEKNRDGPAPVDVEFDKDFSHYRFEPEGAAVEERLVDGRLYLE